MASDDALVALAHEARGRALADVSGYSVGAALKAKSGAVYTGCNIENIVLAETVCAEKVAMLKALEAGERAFEVVAVSTVSDAPASPCGSCRQLLHHWGFERVVSETSDGKRAHWTVEALLPAAFRV